jgi:hypothetical protein
MAASDYLKNKWADHSLGTTTYTKPTAVYCSLHTAAPGGTGANEIAVTRVAITFNAASSGAATNSNTVTLAGMPATTATAAGIWDAVSGGNFLYPGTISSNVTTASGDSVKFDPGGITVTVT